MIRMLVTSLSIVFAPNNPGARVVVKSFNFHPYYVSNERFTYNVTLLAGATVVSGPTTVTFASDATKDHPVTSITPERRARTRVAARADRLGRSRLTRSRGMDSTSPSMTSFSHRLRPPCSHGPEVASVSPADKETGAPAVYSYRAGIAERRYGCGARVDPVETGRHAGVSTADHLPAGRDDQRHRSRHPVCSPVVPRTPIP